MLDRWEHIGVGLLLCDFPMLSDLSNPFGKAMIQPRRRLRRDRAQAHLPAHQEALALRKRKQHAHSRFPGYGFRWERRRDREHGKPIKIKVRDDDERRVMSQIVAWRSEDHGWDAITLLLARHGVTTKDGTPWSRSRVIRAFRAELVLQDQEARSTG